MAADFCITGEVKLNSDPAEKATSKWTVAAGQLIADFAKKAASSLQSVVKSGLDYNRSMESYLTNFKVMLATNSLPPRSWKRYAGWPQARPSPCPT